MTDQNNSKCPILQQAKQTTIKQTEEQYFSEVKKYHTMRTTSDPAVLQLLDQGMKRVIW